MHLLSPVPTLQGAVAHSDMPLESGPTLYLPYSHQYVAGYLAWRRRPSGTTSRRPTCSCRCGGVTPRSSTRRSSTGAGSNVSADIQRVANLLQVSSGFGRAMEYVDRVKVAKAAYPALKRRHATGADPDALVNGVAAAAEGYPFATDLDHDQPVDGLTPLAQTEILARALAEDWTPARLDEALDACAGWAGRPAGPCRTVFLPVGVKSPSPVAE